MKLNFIAKLIALFIVLIAIGTIFLAQNGHKENSFERGEKMTYDHKINQDYSYKGKALRAAIDIRFNELRESGAITGGSSHKNLIRDTVISHIQIGCNFDEAESILKSAGFSVGERGEMYPHIRKNDFGVMSLIYIHKPEVFQKYTIEIILRPVSPYVWNSVRDIETYTTLKSL